MQTPGQWNLTLKVVLGSLRAHFCFLLDSFLAIQSQSLFILLLNKYELSFSQSPRFESNFSNSVRIRLALRVGLSVGVLVGTPVGDPVGSAVGLLVGISVGELVGAAGAMSVKLPVGIPDGMSVCLSFVSPMVLFGTGNECCTDLIPTNSPPRNTSMPSRNAL